MQYLRLRSKFVHCGDGILSRLKIFRRDIDWQYLRGLRRPNQCSGYLGNSGISSPQQLLQPTTVRTYERCILCDADRLSQTTILIVQRGNLKMMRRGWRTLRINFDTGVGTDLGARADIVQDFARYVWRGTLFAQPREPPSPFIFVATAKTAMFTGYTRE